MQQQQANKNVTHTYYTANKVPVNFRYSITHQKNKSMDYRPPLQSKNQNNKTMGEQNIEKQYKRGISISIVNRHNKTIRDESHQQRQTKKYKVINNSYLKPCAKPLSINTPRTARNSQNQPQFNNYFTSLVDYDFLPTPSHNSQLKHKNISSLNAQIKHTTSINHQQDNTDSSISTLRFINEKLKELKISESIDPIVQPYRDGSRQSYKIGPGYNYHRNSSHSSSISNSISKQQSSKNVRPTSDNLYSTFRYSQSPQSKTSKRVTYMDFIKQDTEQQQQSQQLSTPLKSNGFPHEQQMLFDKQNEMEDINFKIDNTKKRIYVFPTLPVQSQIIIQKVNQEQQRENQESQAQKCARITQLYQPYSMQMSSNRKQTTNTNSIASPPNGESVVSQTKPALKYQNTTKQYPPVPHLQMIEEEDKWDKILRLRQMAMNPNSHLLSEPQSQENRKKLMTTFSTALKHPYFATPAYSINQSIPQSLRSSVVLNNSNNPKNNLNVTQKQFFDNLRKGNTDKKPDKALAESQQRQQLQHSSYSYHNQPQFQYSYVEQPNNNTSQTYKNKSEQPNIQKMFNKMKNISLPINLQSKQHSKTQKSKQLSVNRNKLQVNNESGNKKHNIIIKTQNNIGNRQQQNTLQQMKYSYSFEQNKLIQHKQEKQIFSKFLQCKDIEWMLYYQNMVELINVRIKQNIGQDILKMGVKIGDTEQSIQQNRMIGYYIGLWLKSMGYEQKQVKQRVIDNIELMFMDYQDVMNKDKQQKSQINSRRNSKRNSPSLQRNSEQKYGIIRQIGLLMYNDLLYGYLPGDLQLMALLQVCKRGWEYFTFLICRIIKILMKVNKSQRKQNKLVTILNDGWNFNDEGLYSVLQQAIAAQ